jgi:starch synthase
MAPALRVLFATSEIAPWAKTGGLGDVSAALPQALLRLGVDVRVVVPGYSSLLAAFPERTSVATIAHPAGLLPSSTLIETHTASGLPLLMVHCPAFYERPGGPYQNPDGFDWPDNYLRFGLLSKVAALLASDASPLPWRPQILHCNDWQTGLAPAYQRYRLPSPAASVMTIHNLLFQGMFPAATMAPLDLPPHAFVMSGVEFHGNLSFLKAGLQLGDWITTVSPTYAREIQTPEFGYGLEGLLAHRSGEMAGILNGIDDAWDPASDPHIAAQYDFDRIERKAQNKAALQNRLGLRADPNAPLLAVVSRLTYQKGLDLLAAVGDNIAARGAQLALLGGGEHWMQDAFTSLARRYPGQFAAVIGYDEPLAHQIEAGGDIFLMPSRFEPCGLNQMYSLRYGTPPLVRATGGLADTVVDGARAGADGNANGFAFDAPDAAAFLAAIDRALEAWRDKPRWRQLQAAGMRTDFSWGRAAQAYVAVYRKLIAEPV